MKVGELIEKLKECDINAEIRIVNNEDYLSDYAEITSILKLDSVYNTCSSQKQNAVYIY